jgi:ribonucleoside-diphosphate reductase alpha chain
MQIVKRDGSKESVKLEKISKRIERHCKDLKNIDAISVAQKVVQGLYEGVSSVELDQLAMETSYSMSVKHPEYDKLATRLAISALHKATDSTFSGTIEKLYSVKDANGNEKPLISKTVYKFIKKNAAVLDSAIDYNRDYLFDYFGFKTLERSYLMKVQGAVVERPQHMWMRVACGIHSDDIDAALNTYQLLSTMKATHATPTLFNAGTPKNQLSSCFLVAMKEDSIEGIYDTIKEMALISQSAGGLGLHVHNIRSKGSPIYGTGGTSNGLTPMLRVIDTTLKFIDQGGNKRKGSSAIYLEPTHPDIFDFLDLRKNNGKEEMRARDLNLAIWASDLFFKKVEADEDWHLMDPNVSKGLQNVYDESDEGGSYTNLYNKYVSEGKYVRAVKARDVWAAILTSQIETGQPYILSKDACNRKSNQKNLGVISSSNLCAEVVEYTSSEETAVCNLASVSLPSYVEGKKGKRSYNFAKLEETVKTLVENLDKIIDIEYYPVETARRSNLAHRPTGIGIQGLADVFAQMRLSWESEDAKKLNRDISEAIYYAALKTSCELSKKKGKYSTFDGSPASEGILQFDMWGVSPSDRYDWNSLKEDIKKYGLRNSLSIALMPTASSSQIIGNTECFEPITSNIYKRATLSGEFIQVNKYLVEDLIELGLWNDTLRQKIIAANGSIQNIPEIPDHIKPLYKTVWEISQRAIIDMAADRGTFTCQSQSMNLYFKDANFAKLSSAYIYAWKKGLKTIVYYTRTTAARDAIKFTVDKDIEKEMQKSNEEAMEGIVCSLDNPEACVMCSS